MTSTPLSHPSDIARETFRRIAAQKIAPTPENYRRMYHEVAGTTAQETAPNLEFMRLLQQSLPGETPGQLRLLRELDEAGKRGSWPQFTAAFNRFIKAQEAIENLAWGELIGSLLREWETARAGLTQAKKRDALEHVLGSAGGSAENLYVRLNSLSRAWAQAPRGEVADVVEADLADAAAPPAAGKGEKPAAEARAGLFGTLRDILLFTLDEVLKTQVADSPEACAELGKVVIKARRAGSEAEFKALLTAIKKLNFHLVLLSDERSELRQGVVNLLQLVVENIGELVIDDSWLYGQVAMLRDIVAAPLHLRAIDDAGQRIKELVFRQTQLKNSLIEARDALKTMLAGFVDHLAEFADSTSDYHDKIELCAQKVSAASNINELADVIQEVMRETRLAQINAQRSRDELQATRLRVSETEQRISELQEELERTSSMVRSDQLTGALNRRGLDEAFAREAARCSRRQTPLSLALLDIDNFKKLNDSLGHDAGDSALEHLVQVIRQTMRPQDTVARFGGEEFVILLPDTDIKAAEKALVRLQRELTRQFFMHNNEKRLITFSAGVTELGADEDQVEIMKRADAAMYEAKRSGKNRVIAA